MWPRDTAQDKPTGEVLALFPSPTVAASPKTVLSPIVPHGGVPHQVGACNLRWPLRMWWARLLQVGWGGDPREGPRQAAATNRGQLQGVTDGTSPPTPQHPRKSSFRSGGSGGWGAMRSREPQEAVSGKTKL